MYSPEAFKIEDRATLRAFLRQHNFATLVTQHDGGLQATHVPLVLKEEGIPWEGLGYVAILGVVGTGLALMFYNRLIHLTTPVFASSVTYLIPLVAVGWGIVDGEVFRASYIGWMLLILTGVALVNRKRPLWRPGTTDKGHRT